MKSGIGRLKACSLVHGHALDSDDISAYLTDRLKSCFMDMFVFFTWAKHGQPVWDEINTESFNLTKQELLVYWEKGCCPRLDWGRDTTWCMMRESGLYSGFYILLLLKWECCQQLHLSVLNRLRESSGLTERSTKCERHFAESSNYSSAYYASSTRLIWPNTNTQFLSFLPPPAVSFCAPFMSSISKHPLWYTQSQTVLFLFLSQCKKGSKVILRDEMTWAREI